MRCIIDQTYSVPHLKSNHLSTFLPTLSQSLCVCGILNTTWTQPLAGAGQVKLIHRGRTQFTDQKKRRGHLKTFFLIEQTWPMLPFQTFCGYNLCWVGSGHKHESREACMQIPKISGTSTNSCVSFNVFLWSYHSFTVLFRDLHLFL